MKRVTYIGIHNLLHLVLFVAFYLPPSIPMLMDIGNITFIQKDCWKEDPITLLLEPGIRTFSDNDIKVIECEAEAMSNIYFLEPGGNINPDIFPLLLWCLVTIFIFWTIWHYRVSIDIEKWTIRVGWKNVDVGLMENIEIINKPETPIQRLNESRVSNSEIQFDILGKHYRIHSDEYSISGIYYMAEAIIQLQNSKKIHIPLKTQMYEKSEYENFESDSNKNKTPNPIHAFFNDNIHIIIFILSIIFMIIVYNL